MAGPLAEHRHRGVAGDGGDTCLGDVLAAHGYNTVPMTGADVDFGGKGTFHASHGFVERLGFNALNAKAGAAAQQTWGR